MTICIEKEVKMYYAGLDIGGTKCSFVIGNDELEILEKKVFNTKDLLTPERILERYVSYIENAKREFKDIAGIGISVGGPLNSRKGLILSPPNLPGWDDIHITEYLEDKTGIPARLQRDASASAWAEWKYGAGKGTENMIFLTFGTGMGAGLILNGKLYVGSTDGAGEIGHVRLEEKGPEGYGKSGSFEGFCSGGGISRYAEMLDGKMKSAKDIFEEAKNGNPTASFIVNECGKYLGRGISILIDILNPEMIVIGSIYARSGEMLKNEMWKELEKETLPKSLSTVKIRPALLGEKLGDIAALAIAKDRL